jgi:hypothetical protein
MKNWPNQRVPPIDTPPFREAFLSKQARILVRRRPKMGDISIWIVLDESIE